MNVPLGRSVGKIGRANVFLCPLSRLHLRKYWARYFSRALKLFVRGTMSSPCILGLTGELRSCSSY